RESHEVGPRRRMVNALSSVVQKIKPLGMCQERQGETGQHKQAAQTAQHREDEELLVHAKDLPAAAGQRETGCESVEHERSSRGSSGKRWYVYAVVSF